MGKNKKRSDGRLTRTFTWNGKRYFVYGRTPKELNDKETEKRQELEEGEEDRTNPTLNNYYKYFTDVRRGSVQESSIRAQAFMFGAVAGIEINGNKKKLGELRIKEITPKDMQFVQMVLANSVGNTLN